MGENNMRSLIGKRIERKEDFMGIKVTIVKLTVNEVKEIQNRAREIQAEEKARNIEAGESPESFEMLHKIIRMSVPEARELTEEEFDQYPLDELQQLSAKCMKFSGLGEHQGK